MRKNMASKQSVKHNCFKEIIILFSVTGIVLSLNSCIHSTSDNDSETIVKSDVTVTHPIEKDISIYKEFQGITQFAQHLQIRAQSTGIVSKGFIWAIPLPICPAPIIPTLFMW